MYSQAEIFNSQETILLQFTSCLNPTNFEIVNTKNLQQHLNECKQFGKPLQELDTNDDLLKVLGIKILKNVFTIKNQPVTIYLFVSERFPQEIPQVYISQEARKGWKYKYFFQNPEELKKDGKYNLALIIAKVQNQINRNGIKIEYSHDLKNLKDTFSPDLLLNEISKIEISSLTSSKNPSSPEIAQQFKISKQNLAIVQYFSQVSMLNDTIISDIRSKQEELQIFQKTLLQQGYQLERCKKDFAASFCAVQGIKSRFSKFSIMQWLQEKIQKLVSQVEAIEKKPFSTQIFTEYKTTMKQLKRLQLMKQKIS